MTKEFLLHLASEGFEAGFRPYNRTVTAAQALRFRESLKDVERGRKHPAVWLYENQTRSDFPLLNADSTDRAMLGGFAEYVPTYTQYTRATTVSDFKAAKRFTMDGAEGLLEPIAELGPYPHVSVTEGKYEISVSKYGQKMGFSFEAMVNDDLGALDDTPRRFGRAARRTRENVVTKAYASTASLAAFFTSGNANQIITTNGAATNNPKLGVQGLIDAVNIMSRKVDADGQPISIEAMNVVYPPSLAANVMEIKQLLKYQTDLRIGTAGTAGSSETRAEVDNWFGGFNFIPNSQLLMMDTGAATLTGWFAFANPNDSRPALMVAELRGHQVPELFQRIPDSMRAGGGVDMASFDNDASGDFKIRDFIGVTRIEPRAALYSDGSGS